MADPISIPPLESPGDHLPHRQPSQDEDGRERRRKPKQEDETELNPLSPKSSSDENVGRNLDLEV